MMKIMGQLPEDTVFRGNDRLVSAPDSMLAWHELPFREGLKLKGAVDPYCV
jgi:hypothetical protein